MKTAATSSNTYSHELQPTSPSQYAEADRNPFPEVVMSSAPEPVFVAASPPSSLQPDHADDIRNSIYAPAPSLHEETKWEKAKDWATLHKCWLVAAGAALLIALVTAIIAVAVVSRHHSAADHQHGSPVTSSTTHRTIIVTSTTTHKSSQTSPTASATATASLLPPVCDSPANFIRGVTWMGIAGVSGGWKWRLASTTDAAGCCARCFAYTPEGCDAWAFMPTGGSTATACNIIYGWATEGDHSSDKTCPKGHADVQFQRGGGTTFVGGAGPCGRVV